MRHINAKATVLNIEDAGKVMGEKNYDELKDELEHICFEIASRFNLYYSNGTPRKATIIEALWSSTCVSCICKKLTNTTLQARIDNIYAECHKFAVSVLIEELQQIFSEKGYSVLIVDEYQKEFGKVDVLVRLTNYGIYLKSEINELIVEVKTGFSISLPQIMRYLLGTKEETIIVWRIRNRQVLFFDATKFRFLLIRFMKTIVMRGNRLLAASESKCKHANQDICWSPTENDIQEMLEDFADTLVETLPHVTERIFETLKLKDRKESAARELSISGISPPNPDVAFEVANKNLNEGTVPTDQNSLNDKEKSMG